MQPTLIDALDEENAQSRAPQHPTTYRQPEGNRDV